MNLLTLSSIIYSQVCNTFPFFFWQGSGYVGGAAGTEGLVRTMQTAVKPPGREPAKGGSPESPAILFIAVSLQCLEKLLKLRDAQILKKT